MISAAVIMYLDSVSQAVTWYLKALTDCYWQWHAPSGNTLCHFCVVSIETPPCSPSSLLSPVWRSDLKHEGRAVSLAGVKTINSRSQAEHQTSNSRSQNAHESMFPSGHVWGYLYSAVFWLPRMRHVCVEWSLSKQIPMFLPVLVLYWRNKFQIQYELLEVSINLKKSLI